MSDQEYKFLGNTMENVSIKYGLFLVAWGVGISWISQSESVTSLIPAFLGFLIFVFGWLARINPEKKKIFMHIVVSFGLLAFLGGLDFVRGIGSEFGSFANPYAASSKIVLLLSGGLFCFLCIKSFRFARKKNPEV
tara:strand:+ start:376 stop:783 length:408 start_codon:yes stop_codon:yes gene_type:complete